jgi:hypothetical protein
MPIKTITTSYNLDEERLCLAVVDEAGQQGGQPEAAAPQEAKARAAQV